MEKSVNSANKNVMKTGFTILYFLLNFFYFLLFNTNHLLYQEQIQLFRFDSAYFYEFLSRPGGLAEYAGTFIIQFYIFPLAASFLVTILSVALYFAIRSLLKKFKISGIYWSLVPVLIIAVLQSDHIYYAGYTIAFILAVLFFNVYSSIENRYIRLVSGNLTWFLLYMVVADFAFISAAVIVLYEVFTAKNYKQRLFVFVFVFIVFLSMIALFRFVYILPVTYRWINPLIYIGNLTTKIGLFLLFAYLPLILLLNSLLIWLSRTLKFTVRLTQFFELAAMVMFLVISVVLVRYSCDYKTEILLGIDKSIVKSDWESALKYSAKSPGSNQIVVYLTNIALYKSGKMCDNMFNYNQIGNSGLWLGWGSDASPFFGSEVFYQIGYINEAQRWAFEAMVAQGQAPRLMKRLALTSLINYDVEVGEKYLYVLKNTLFYRKWASYYLKLAGNQDMLKSDPEIADKRRFLLTKDFLADVNRHDLELVKLLGDQPDNKMAYEYLMASLLLQKDLDTFIIYLRRLKEFGYNEIPVHFEEALLAKKADSDNGLIPEGYTIRESTRQMFAEYLKTSASYSGNPDVMAKFMSRRFGGTYWFYLQFK